MEVGIGKTVEVREESEEVDLAAIRDLFLGPGPWQPTLDMALVTLEEVVAEAERLREVITSVTRQQDEAHAEVEHWRRRAERAEQDLADAEAATAREWHDRMAEEAITGHALAWLRGELTVSQLASRVRAEVATADRANSTQAEQAAS